METENFLVSGETDISREALDFFSIGHAVMGQIFFWIFYMLFSSSSAPFLHLGFTQWWCVLFSLEVGILWALIENNFLFKAGLKFENRRDFQLNSIFNILFWFLGALLSLLINNPITNIFLVIIELLTLFIVIFEFWIKK